MAVRLFVTLFECSFVQLLETESADKVFWVEFLAHCCDASTKDWLMAAVAKTTSTFVVVKLTERLVLVLKEVATCKCLLTSLTDIIKL